jgi:tetratricopeptide (TPR) repeat protein
VDEVLGSFSEEKAAALSSILRENGTWQCPTLTVLHMLGYGDDRSFRSDPRLKYMPPRMVAGWDLTYGGIRNQDDIAAARKEFQKDLEIVGIMQRLGVGILAGTDTQNPFSLYGFSLHDELGFLVRAGLTPMQALQSATLNPARFFARERDLGTIEKGKFADLVLLNADPLIDIGNTRKIDAVLLDGNVFSRAALDEMLANVEMLARRKGVSEVLIQTIQEKGVNAALAQYRDLKLTRRDTYDFSEDDLIALGYRLINMHKYNEAIAVFGLSVEEYPASYNTYDSLAEAYMDNGNTELAIQNYKKSLELNPNNKNGIEMLKKLTAR